MKFEQRLEEVKERADICRRVFQEERTKDQVGVDLFNSGDSKETSAAGAD